MTCTRCEGTGFLNSCQISEDISVLGIESIKTWMLLSDSDVQVCDCCGDGEGWHGEPGRHYTSLDPIGKLGPYAYNGGLCECN